MRQQDSAPRDEQERRGILQHALRTQLNNIVSYAALLLYDAERAHDGDFANELGAIEKEARSILESIARIATDEPDEAADADATAGKALADSIRRRVWRLQGSPIASNAQIASDLQQIGGSAQRLAALLRSVGPNAV